MRRWWYCPFKQIGAAIDLGSKTPHLTCTRVALSSRVVQLGDKQTLLYSRNAKTVRVVKKNSAPAHCIYQPLSSLIRTYCVFTCSSHVICRLIFSERRIWGTLWPSARLQVDVFNPHRFRASSLSWFYFFTPIKMIQKRSLFNPRSVNFNSCSGKPPF
jgi:hypothetical protein